MSCIVCFNRECSCKWNRLFVVFLFFMTACSSPQVDESPKVEEPVQTEPQVPSEPDVDTPEPVKEVSLEGATKIKLWATYYYVQNAKAVDSGIPLRDMSDRSIGPKLDSSTWCRAAIEGTVSVDGQVYNYAGTKNPRQTSCSHSPSERVRWKKSPFKYGIGNKSNALVPFKSLACDQGSVRKSRKFWSGGYLDFDQKVYIPDAKGTKLPNGDIHDGVFICHDVGGAIYGNHIDVFLGDIPFGMSEREFNPFSWIKSNSSKTFDAYVLP